MSDPTDPQGPAAQDHSQQQGAPLSRRAARDASGSVPRARRGRTPATPVEPTGLGALIAKHPTAWLLSVLGVVFVLLAVGAVFAGVSIGSASAVGPSAAPSVIPPRPIPSAIAAGAALRTCSVASAASNSALGDFSGSVINTTTGEALFDRKGTDGVAPASVMKVLTASTALSVLGPDYQFETKVYSGAAAGSIVLVGGGDATLSALSSGQESVYKGAPKLDDLATQVKAKWNELNPGKPITSIILDANMWNPSDNWDPSWPTSERTQGYQPLITALMVDGDRQDPKAQTSPRSTDPVGAAGDAFISALGLPASTPVSTGSAITSNAQLGSVKSQSIKTLIGQMLPNSDNTLAEMMARVSSKNGGRDGSSGSLTAIYSGAMSGYGFPTSTLTIKDGSGESNLDGVPPQLVAKLMVLINGGTKNLDTIYNALPVAGKTGTLASRFSGANAVARGAVNAKTGSIATAYALAGIVHAKDGAVLSFAIFAEGKLNGSSAMSAIDTVTTGFFNCGNNLSNN